MRGCVEAVYKTGGCIGCGQRGNLLVDVACLIEAVHIFNVFIVSGRVHVEQNLLLAVYFILLPEGVNAECTGDRVNEGGVSVKGKRGLFKVCGHFLENVGQFVQRFGNVQVECEKEVIVENKGVLDVVAGCALGNTVDSAVNRNHVPGFLGDVCKKIGSKDGESVCDINKKILINKVTELILCQFHCIIGLFVHQLGVQNLGSICSGQLRIGCLVACELLDEECIGAAVDSINTLARVGHQNAEVGLLRKVDIVIDVVALFLVAFAGCKSTNCTQKHCHAKNER